MVTAYSASALLLPPGTLATAMPSRRIASRSSAVDAGAGHLHQLAAPLPSNSSGASFGPTAGITSARAAVSSAGTSASSGAR